MKNISIKGVCNCVDLDRNIKLTNGAIIIQKENDNVIGVYLVTSFRDNKNKYGGDNTSHLYFYHIQHLNDHLRKLSLKENTYYRDHILLIQYFLLVLYSSSF